ncbi:HPr kinase/phosphatase C-terminal domain-containing protein [Thalassobius aquimarinus]|uniref:HPr kinase/phosphatase C-terminal domain-containing protein n=1 Tax=Thalassovita aquimarina TaxID=2785917 RepID=A0ABS5HQ52_9RHOB|nr:HPr kinase/phosphatase C-terminal domain-containing protein [Thalassovita aquimarina]
MPTRPRNRWARASSWACRCDVGRPADKDCLILHASTVALDGRAVVITGRAGAGKSALALQLMALGAGLVSDDRTCIWKEGETLWADAPGTIRGQIEARFVGILNAVAVGPARARLWVDLGREETLRLPEKKTVTVLGLSRPLLHNVQMQHFPAAILHYLKSGRRD